MSSLSSSLKSGTLSEKVQEKLFIQKILRETVFGKLYLLSGEVVSGKWTLHWAGMFPRRLKCPKICKITFQKLSQLDEKILSELNVNICVNEGWPLWMEMVRGSTKQMSVLAANQIMSLLTTHFFLSICRHNLIFRVSWFKKKKSYTNLLLKKISQFQTLTDNISRPARGINIV